MQLLSPVLVGLAGNYMFPHAGEMPRAVLASVAIERIFDFLAILVIVLAILAPVGRMSADIQTASYFVGALCATILTAVVVFVFRTETCLRLAERMLSLVSRRVNERILGQLRAAGAGLGAIASPRLLTPVFLLSILQWLLIAGTVACSLMAVEVPVTLAGAVSALLLNVIGLTLPAAPGHVGTVQLAFIVGLAPFGVTRSDALAGSIIYNVLTVVPTVILGLPGLRRASLELRARLMGR